MRFPIPRFVLFLAISLLFGLPGRGAAMPSGLVAYWTFDVDANSSVGGWTGAVQSQAQVGANGAFLGDGCYFLPPNALDGFIQTDFSPPAGNAPRSVSLWFRNNPGASFYQPLFGWGSTEENARYDLFLKDKGFKLEFESNSTDFTSFWPGNPFGHYIKPGDARWHHALLTYADEGPSDHFLYIDGKPPAFWNGTVVVPDTGDAVKLRIGAGVRDTSGFPGRIDDFGVFDQALTGSDAALIHGLGRFGIGLAALDAARALMEMPAGSTAEIVGRTWEKVARFEENQGDYGGSIGGGDAYIVANYRQKSGIRLHPAPTAPPEDLSAVPPDDLQFQIGYGLEESFDLALANGNATLPADWVILTDPGSAPDLEQLPGLLDANAESLFSIIPDRHDFSEGRTGNHIENGGGNMYDSGNFLAFDGITMDYTDGSVSAVTTQSGNARYFTHKLDGLFVMGAQLDGVGEFSVTGKLGAGKYGRIQTKTFTVFSGGRRWRMFTNQVYGKKTPTVCQIILVPDDPAVSRTNDGDLETEDHRISGLSSTKRLYYLLFSRADYAHYANQVFLDLATSFLALADNSPTWFQPTPMRGTLASGQSSAIPCRLVADGLQSGTYSTRFAATTIRTSPEAIPENQWHPVEITVGEPTFSLEPDSVFVATPRGITPSPRQIRAVPAEGAPAPTGLQAKSSEAWVVPTVSGDHPDTITLEFATAGLETGTHTAILDVWNSRTKRSITVTLATTSLAISRIIPDPSRPGTLYAVNSSKDGQPRFQLLRLDAATGEINNQIDIGPGVTDIDIDPATDRLYVVNSGSPESRVVDLSDFRPLDPVPLGPSARLVEADGHGRLYVGMENEIVIWDLNEMTSSPIPATFRPKNMELDARNGILYWRGDSDLHKLDVHASPPAELMQCPVSRINPTLVLSDDGSRLVCDKTILNPDFEIVANLPERAIAMTSGGELAATQRALYWVDGASAVHYLPSGVEFIAFSSDGKHLVYFERFKSSFVSIPLQGSYALPGPWPRPAQTLATPPDRISWNPVSSAISYTLDITNDAGETLTYPGLVEPFLELPAPLPGGWNYRWQVTVETPAGPVAGSNKQFSVRFPQVTTIRANAPDPKITSIVFGDDCLALGIPASSQDVSTEIYNFDPRTAAHSPRQILESPDDDRRDHRLALDGESVFVGSGFIDFERRKAIVPFRPDPTRRFLERQAPFFPDGSGEYFHSESVFAVSGGILMVRETPEETGLSHVSVYTTEPALALRQVLRPEDSFVGDGFGTAIAIHGNTAVISAPGMDSRTRSKPSVYVFRCAPATGRWDQTQKIEIPETHNYGLGTSIDFTDDFLAVNNEGKGEVHLFAKNPAGQWVFDRTLNSRNDRDLDAIKLAFHQNLLFVSGTRKDGSASNGVVYPFRHVNSEWIECPAIVAESVPCSSAGLGPLFSTRNGWLAAVAGDGATVFRIGEDSRIDPVFQFPLPAHALAGQSMHAPVFVDDPDGNEGLAIEMLRGPAWASLTDHGEGRATLEGTPTDAPGTSYDFQLRATASDGASALQSFRLTLLSEDDAPVIVAQPRDAEIGEGQDLVLRAETSGAEPFTWQWRKSGIDIPGANRAVLQIENATPADAASYSVAVSNAAGSAVSRPARVAVHPPDRRSGPWVTCGRTVRRSNHSPASLGRHLFIPAWQYEPAAHQCSDFCPVVAENTVFFPERTVDAKVSLVALSLTNGKPVWRHLRHGAPPSYHNGRLYLMAEPESGSGIGVTCLEAATGDLLWAGSGPRYSYSMQTPLVTDDGIWTALGTIPEILGFAPDGEMRFQRSIAHDQQPDLLLAVYQDRLFSTMGASFSEHNPFDGTALWSVETGTTPSYPNSPFAVAENHALVRNRNQLACIDLGTRSVLWSRETGGTYNRPPAIAGGVAYDIRGSDVHSYSLADGTPGRIFPAPSEHGLQQVLVLNDYLIASSNSETYIFDLGTGALVQTLDCGGNLAYADGYLIALALDGKLHAWFANIPPTLDVADTLVLNLQTGLYEHTITVTNTDPRAIPGFDLTITNLPDGVCVWNASDCTGGATSIQHRQPLAAGASTTLVLEYYAPVRGTEIKPTISVDLAETAAPVPADPDGGFAIDRLLCQRDGSLLIEFTSEPGALYEIHYSDDGTNWKLSPVRVRAAGNRVQWIDRGPPRTDTAPSETPVRFYRVKRIQTEEE